MIVMDCNHEPRWSIRHLFEDSMTGIYKRPNRRNQSAAVPDSARTDFVNE
jgi:hypothetical protein